jgi:hypothetical protein
MDKTIIKQLLRETFEIDSVENIEEANTPKPVRKKLKAEYTEIRRALSKNNLGAPSQADIMALAGLGSKGDKTAESLFSKKLRRAKNEEGGVYQFDEEERANIIKAINKAKKS